MKKPALRVYPSGTRTVRGEKFDAPTEPRVGQALQAGSYK